MGWISFAIKCATANISCLAHLLEAGSFTTITYASAIFGWHAPAGHWHKVKDKLGYDLLCDGTTGAYLCNLGWAEKYGPAPKGWRAEVFWRSYGGLEAFQGCNHTSVSIEVHYNLCSPTSTLFTPFKMSSKPVVRIDSFESLVVWRMKKEMSKNVCSRSMVY